MISPAVDMKLTRHVAETTARVAGLAGTATVAASVAAEVVVATEGGLGAVAGNVTDLATLDNC
jgi:hypothetical protein